MLNYKSWWAEQIFKGGAGSGNYDGPGEPRFARDSDGAGGDKRSVEDKIKESGINPKFLSAGRYILKTPMKDLFDSISKLGFKTKENYEFIDRGSEKKLVHTIYADKKDIGEFRPSTRELIVRYDWKQYIK